MKRSENLNINTIYGLKSKQKRYICNIVAKISWAVIFPVMTLKLK